MDEGEAKGYYIDTSYGKICFTSTNVEHIYVYGSKLKEYNHFKPINNTKFLKIANRYQYCGTIPGVYVTSKKTKNGVFLLFHTKNGEIEYKIYNDKNYKVNKLQDEKSKSDEEYDSCSYSISS
jgi:hypothetical protein